MVEVAISLVQHPEWVRFPAFVEGDEVVLDKSRAERYWLHEPEQVEQMAFDFAAMAFHRSGRDPQQAVAFVRRYGLLWHGANAMGSGECRESLDNWWHEVEKLSSLLLTSVRLGQATREGSAAPVRRHFEALGIGFETDEAYLMAATTIAARMIYQGMQDTRWGMEVIEPGEPRLAHYPPKLVSAAYANFGALISKKEEFKECPGCGRVFLPASGTQKYHDQYCATRTKQRRWMRNKSENM
ncbi:MAG TPA: hypothetical protein VFI90_10190 [Rubrobacter sp.]|nr:hypothetical protein [Rubrobacter sp.]